MSKKGDYQSFFNWKRIFHFPKLTTKTLCSLGLLIAITLVLSFVSGHLRIGNISKLNISFVSVFITAYLYGGITGGIVAVLADIISWIVNPTGPFLIELTLIELLFGFIYGIFFYRFNSKHYIISVIFCDIIQFTVNILLKTFVLSSIYGTAFNPMFITRLPMCIIQMIIIFISLLLIKPFLKSIMKISSL